MEIWDDGTYLIRRAPSTAAALAAGEIKVVLRGRRLRGEWHLVRTAGAGGRLAGVFKARDRYARSPGDPPAAVDLSGARRAPVPARPRPMRPADERAAFSDAGWLFEMEFAGRRRAGRLPRRTGRAARRGWRSRLRLRRDPRLPLPAARGARGDRRRAGGGGRTRGVRRVPSSTVWPRTATPPGSRSHAFDLLHYEEWDVRGLPLVERKALLKSVLAAAGQHRAVRGPRRRGRAIPGRRCIGSRPARAGGEGASTPPTGRDRRTPGRACRSAPTAPPTTCRSTKRCAGGRRRRRTQHA